MLTRTCDGCGRVVADDDQQALRNLIVEPGEQRRLLDWCGDCVLIIRAELPRLAAQAREARLAAESEPVRSRVLNVRPDLNSWMRGSST